MSYGQRTAFRETERENMNMSECVCMYLSSLQLKTTKSVPGGEQVEFATHCSKEEWTL